MKLSNIGKEAVKKIYPRVILMGVALILLVAALVFFTTAWYTKMVSTAGVNLNAAQWDFTANHTIDAVNVNVYEYASLTKNRAAPGTAGWIPMTLGARQSDTDITYYLSVDRSTMSEEFRDRIFFYYYKDGVINEANKIYFGASPDDPDSTDQVMMTGTIPGKGSAEVKVYWEWIYESPVQDTVENADEIKKAWDEFDTKVGKDPALYSQDMNAAITVVGVEVNPKDTAK